MKEPLLIWTTESRIPGGMEDSDDQDKTVGSKNVGTQSPRNE